MNKTYDLNRTLTGAKYIILMIVATLSSTNVFREAHLSLLKCNCILNTKQKPPEKHMSVLCIGLNLQRIHQNIH